MTDEMKPAHEQLKAILEELRRQAFNTYGMAGVTQIYNEKESKHLTASLTGNFIDFSEPVDAIIVWTKTAQAAVVNIEESADDIGATTTISFPIEAVVGKWILIPLKCRRVYAKRTGDTDAELVIWGFR